MTLRDKIAHTICESRAVDNWLVQARDYELSDAILSVIAESVEPLEWEGFRAGSYYIEMDATGVANLYNNQDRDDDGCIDSMMGGFVNLVSIDDLKDAAQADYTRRILSGLGLSTPEQEKGE